MEHRVNLDYASKRFTLRTDENCEIVMIGDYRDYIFNAISALVEKRLARKGCKAFLTFISDSASTKLSVKDIWTMNDFSDVFLEELPGVPLTRVAEIGIDLLLSATFVFIAPYHMASKELAELIAQLRNSRSRIH